MKERNPIMTILETIISIIWISMGVMVIIFKIDLEYVRNPLKEVVSEVELKDFKEVTFQEIIPEKYEIDEVIEEMNAETVYYDIVQTETEEVEPYYIETVEEILLTIPESIMSSFIENEWNIYVTTEDIAKKYFDGRYSKVRAMTRRSEKKIVVEAREEAVRGSVEHEIGHFLDYINGEVSYSNEFAEIYYEEVEVFKSNIDNPSSVFNQCEFFAETFYYIIKDPEKCTPKAKSFVERYIP